MKKCMLVFVWWFFFGQITQQAPKNCPLWATNKWNKAASKKALTTARQALYASNRNELMPWLAPRTSTWNCTKRRRLLQSGGRNCTLNITLKRWDVQLQTKQESVYIYIYIKLKYRWHLTGSKARMMPLFAMKEKHQDMFILRSRQYYKLPCWVWNRQSDSHEGWVRFSWDFYLDVEHIHGTEGWKSVTAERRNEFIYIKM